MNPTIESLVWNQAQHLRGRHPWGALLLWAIAAVVMTIVWEGQVQIDLGDPSAGRGTLVWELVLLSAAPAVALLLASRVRIWEGLAPPERRLCTLLTRVVALFGWAALPWIAWQFSAAPKAYPGSLPMALTFTALLLMSLSLIAVDHLGRVTGALTIWIVVICFLIAQATPALRLSVPLHDSPELRTWPIVASVVATAWSLWSGYARAHHSPLVGLRP